MYDLIGDIHGYASILEELLSKLGYKKRNGSYRHPHRKAIFVGDYIDRGPEIRETLWLVRSMTDTGEAIALMGNHEFNAILFNEPDGKGGYLRPRTQKNKKQHGGTLEQFTGREEEYQSYISWFKTLPLFFETEDLRAIHACWDEDMVEELREYAPNGVLEPEHFRMAGERTHRLYTLTEVLLKGKEVRLPEGRTFLDKEGHERSEMRIRWWLNPQEVTLREWSIIRDLDGLSDFPINPEYLSESCYDEDSRPVFFGHYWLDGTPVVQRSNICCLDYSIGKQDKLVAYRFDGQETLCEEHLEWVEYRE